MRVTGLAKERNSFWCCFVWTSPASLSATSDPQETDFSCKLLLKEAKPSLGIKNLIAVGCLQCFIRELCQSVTEVEKIKYLNRGDKVG